MDAWWTDVGGSIRRSSLADERDIALFVIATGQVECALNHGLVTGPDFAVSLWSGRACGACRAVV